MSVASDEQYKLTSEDCFNKLSKQTQTCIINSWAKEFAEILFPIINGEHFYGLFSKKVIITEKNINIVIGALILKEILNLTEHELYANIFCDIRFRYALHAHDLDEQPFDDKVFGQFRERLYFYMLETGSDLFLEEIQYMEEGFKQFFDRTSSINKIDIKQIALGCKRISYLESLYDCVASMLKSVYKICENHMPNDMEHYLLSDDKSNMVYNHKSDEIISRFQIVTDDAKKLIEILGEEYFDLPEYQLLRRVILEQSKYALC